METHKQTDRMLANLELQLKKMYSRSFSNAKKDLQEVMLKVEFDSDMTPIERYNASQKYERLKKLEDNIAKEINEVNKQAVRIVNQSMNDIYKLNYNNAWKEMAVILAISMPKAQPKASAVSKDISTQQSPFDQLAMDGIKDLDDLKRTVTRQIVSGIMSGENTAKLVKRIQKITEMKLSDITRIARTQTTRIENFGRLKAYESMEKQGYKIYKKWVAVGDNRTRPAHKKVDGTEVPLDDFFIVDGEKMMYPGDPNASPKNTVNCRCTIKSVAKKV